MYGTFLDYLADSNANLCIAETSGGYHAFLAHRGHIIVAALVAGCSGSVFRYVSSDAQRLRAADIQRNLAIREGEIGDSRYGDGQCMCCAHFRHAYGGHGYDNLARHMFGG